MLTALRRRICTFIPTVVSEKAALSVRLHRPRFQRFDLLFCVLLGKHHAILNISSGELKVSDLDMPIDKFFCSFAFHLSSFCAPEGTVLKIK